MRNSLAFLVATAIVSFSACSSTPSHDSPGTRNAPRHHVMVQIMDSYVHPATAEVTAGGTISWATYATEHASAILFPADIKQALSCSDLRPNWNEVAAGIQSLTLSSSSMRDDIELPCPLKPGSYDYKVLLFQPLDGGGMFNPDYTLTGKIVVQR